MSGLSPCVVRMREPRQATSWARASTYSGRSSTSHKRLCVLLCACMSLFRPGQLCWKERLADIGGQAPYVSAVCALNDHLRCPS